MSPTDQAGGQKAGNDGKTRKESGIVGWFYSLMFGGDDPELQKRRLLKQIAKDLGKVKYKFYRPKGEQALTGLAKYFFEIYKITANAAIILANADKSTTLRSICIEHFMSPEQKVLVDHFSEEYIREQSKKSEPKELAAQLKDDLVKFFAGFDSQKVSKINEVHGLITRFLRFVNFDYYFVLKKFDSSLQERSFSAGSKFEAINAEYIVDDIKDFQELAGAIDKTEDWNTAFDVFKHYKGLDPVDRNEWSRVLNYIAQVNASEVLTLIVRHASADPWYKPGVERSSDRIVEPYVEKTRMQVEGAIQKIVHEKRDAHIEKLCAMIFGTREIERTKYYTEKANLSFSKKVSPGYSHTAPINYMKAFLLDYFKKDVRELQELILVRGKWTSNVLSTQLSDIYYQVLAISDQIIAFDESLSEEAELGARVRKAMGRVIDRDASSSNSARLVMTEVNDKAAKLVNDGAQSLIMFGKYLRTTLEDIDKKDHDVIINWKELESLSDIPLKGRMSEVYKKLYYFIQLMQIYSRGGAAGSKKAAAGVDSEE